MLDNGLGEGILPFKSNFLNVAGYRMHYLDEGQGEAVILLHGNPTWCFYYRKLVEELRKSFRVIVPDYIGCGLSDKPEREFRSIERVDQVQTLIDALKLNRFSVVMHDWGGAIGTMLSIRNKGVINKLIYFNTVLTEIQSLPFFIRLAANPWVGKFFTQYSSMFLQLLTNFGAVKKLPDEIKRGYLYPYLSRAKRSAIWGFVNEIPFSKTHPTYIEMMQVAENLPELKNIPVQIIWGIQDPCFHTGILRKFARHFPQAKILEFANAGHLVLEDEPERASEAVKNFLLGHNNLENVGLIKEPKSLFEAFVKHTQERPFSDAVVSPVFQDNKLLFEHINFKELSSVVNQYMRGLAGLGLVKDDRVLLFVPPGRDFLALSYAIMGLGAVPVFIDPGMGVENVYKCVEDAQPAAFIGVPRAFALQIMNRRIFKRLKFSLCTRSLWPFGVKGLNYLEQFSTAAIDPREPSSTAIIAFTSGATGRPKGVLLSQSTMLREVEIIRQELEVQAGKLDMPLLPIFSLFNLALGIGSVIPPVNPAAPLSLNPSKLVWILNSLNISYSFGSPTLWSKIAAYCIRTGRTLGNLENILMAGAPVSKKVIAAVQGVLPQGQVYTPYGATEALPVSVTNAEEVLGRRDEAAVSGEHGTFVGRIVTGLQVRIISPQDGVISQISDATILPPYKIGEVIVKGENVSSEYLNLPEANAKSKIKDADGIWHRMGDMGYFDSKGNLYFCGRKAHMIKLAQKTYYSIPTESIFNAHPKVRRSALVDLSGEVGIVIEPLLEAFPKSKKAKAQFIDELMRLARLDPITADIRKIFFHPSFPVDARHNAKIFRDRLGVWARKQP